jgi:fermentation-respiration switch protein FrsA (DUF1100 family)
LAFRAKEPEEWSIWKERLRNRLTELMALPKERVELEPEVVEARDCDGYVREKVLYKTEGNFFLPAYLLKPKVSGEKPAVLALHGHGRGKVDVAGVYRDEIEYQRFIAPLNYDYGVQLVKRGYVVLAPDGRAFGELASDGMNCTWLLTASMLLGKTVVGMRVWDAMRSIDYLEALPEVDPDRIGCVGLSWGGTWTAYTSALDERIKAAIVSGYFSTFRDMLIERSCCPCQYLSGIRLYADFPDIVALIAPRPLFIEYGSRDPLYTRSEVLKAYEKLRHVYGLLGCDDRLFLDIFEGGHMFSGRNSLPWLDKWLKGC